MTANPQTDEELIAQLVREHDALHAENERLRAALDGLMAESRSSRKAMDRARHKIDELRAALTSATGQADPKCCTVCQE